jgi:hypothetical protein
MLLPVTPFVTHDESNRLGRYVARFEFLEPEPEDSSWRLFSHLNGFGPPQGARIPQYLSVQQPAIVSVAEVSWWVLEREPLRFQAPAPGMTMQGPSLPLPSEETKTI